MNRQAITDTAEQYERALAHLKTVVANESSELAILAAAQELLRATRAMTRAARKARQA
jgi:hypothetical protein